MDFDPEMMKQSIQAPSLLLSHPSLILPDCSPWKPRETTTPIVIAKAAGLTSIDGDTVYESHACKKMHTLFLTQLHSYSLSLCSFSYLTYVSHSPHIHVYMHKHHAKHACNLTFTACLCRGFSDHTWNGSMQC